MGPSRDDFTDSDSTGKITSSLLPGGGGGGGVL